MNYNEIQDRLNEFDGAENMFDVGTQEHVGYCATMCVTQLKSNPFQSDWMDPGQSRRDSYIDSRLRFGQPLVDKAWLFRRIRTNALPRTGYADGNLQMEVIWDARSAIEYVNVGGVRAASKMSLLYVPRFDFAIRIGDHDVPASIDVRVSFLVIVAGFRLSINGVQVYSEGSL